MFQPNRGRFVGFVEACYAEVPDESAWLSGVLDAATSIFGDAGLGICIARDQATGPEIVSYENRGARSASLDEMVKRTPFLSAEVFGALWRPPKPVLLLSHDALDVVPRTERAALEDNLSRHDVRDALAFFGEPKAGLLFVMTVFVEPSSKFRGRNADVLHRLRLHLDAGLRLRYGSGRVVARLTPGGRLEHAEGETKESHFRHALSEGVMAIEQSRRPASRTMSDHEALSMWRALTAGRFSLVDQVDRDGKRHYAVMENAPEARPFRALSINEARILELTLRGLPGKHVAYALGLSEGYVSECLGVAAQKVGCRGTAQLLHVAAQLVAEHDQPTDLARLSESEREVLGLVRAGKTNRQIAACRGTSERTVANQVAAILRAVRVGSRRALITLAARQTADSPET